MPTRDEVASFFSSLGLDRVARPLADLAMPVLRTGLVDFLDGRSVRSRFGGVPLLPPGFAWPTIDGESLLFLGQVDFQELDDGILPEQLPPDCPRGGLLSFFVRPVLGPELTLLQNACRVFWFDNQELVPYRHSFSFEPGLSADLELMADLMLESCQTHRFRHLNLTPEEQRILEQLDAECDDGEPRHHLFGGLMSVNEGTAAEFFRLNETLDRQGHVLLFQCDSDPRLEWLWGDDGRLFFVIPKADLAAREFGRVALVWENAIDREFFFADDGEDDEDPEQTDEEDRHAW